ncbi:uncharacterized protein MCYG_04063 [Microsporum canis CBS 113480]|uniref:Uncharacterized protein n=1 Tax=Arthroderma otae (strain ATCC MYA-4605 / CBS 113480) TaxID=554155 RepID=C5FN08_ARTOC|nr:uncharacterized protein MCYG_04063 [Microsporum canis CBS 113480]EEQ31244.1 predicted protein [Microsporum canis CBS 113480]
MKSKLSLLWIRKKSKTKKFSQVMSALTQQAENSASQQNRARAERLAGRGRAVGRHGQGARAGWLGGASFGHEDTALPDGTRAVPRRYPSPPAQRGHLPLARLSVAELSGAS